MAYPVVVHRGLMNPRLPFFALLLGLLAPGQAAAAQTWTYQLFSGSTGEPMGLSYITLEERAGKALFRMTGVELSVCYRQELPATVTKTEFTTIIEVPPAFASCDHIRFVIKNDGTGGQREVKNGSGWAWDGLNRRLTPQK